MLQKIISPFQKSLSFGAKQTSVHGAAAPSSHLILETRPATLPAKVESEPLEKGFSHPQTAEEERKHRAQYEALMDGEHISKQ